MNTIEGFLGSPTIIFAVSCVFFLSYLVIYVLACKWSFVRSWPLLIVAVAWALFAVWELFCTVKEYNIRVDLFVICPVLIAVTIFGVFVSVGSLASSLLKKQPSTGNKPR